ncbi:MAG: hypothetical protein KKA42_00305, partial [candidate division Zixibacteria bacterium]|nr:hypothetical protein [candidate division Zixibacteria bacterium]
VPQSDYVYLAALPTFMTSVGAIRDGRRITYDQMQEQLRREILDLSASFDFSRRTERTELVVRGSGSDLDESRKALDWMETVLFSPDLSEANLPRIRDAIDAALGGLRNRMRGSEESWVNDPAAAYWKQDNPLLLTTSSFLTRTHAYHRLRWQLKQLPEGPALDELSSFVEGYLAYAADRRNREELSDLLGALGSHLEGGATADSTDLKASLEKYPLTDEARVLARDAVEDLRLMLGGIPDETLASDWHYLCGQIMSDLAVPPAAVLGSVNGILDRIRHQDNVRSFAITNDELLEELRPRLESMVGRFDSGVSERVTLTRRPNVVNRLRERFPDLEWPTFVGLVNPGSRTGVHINSAPCASLVDSDRDTLLNFVAGRIYGGGGAHSMFMKTWSAGLAYSNGLRASEYAGRMSYYAERCPDLSQTMQFVVNELKNAPYDPSLADYAIAQAFTTVRSGGRYENRGESMASDLADGVTPEKVRQFRQGVLELREVPNLYDELHNRMVNSYARVLPGLGGSVKNAEGALFFVIGPEAQMESYEEYLRSVEGADTKLYRLYPRDFWLVE